MRVIKPNTTSQIDIGNLYKTFINVPVTGNSEEESLPPTSFLPYVVCLHSSAHDAAERRGSLNDSWGSHLLSTKETEAWATATAQPHLLVHHVVAGGGLWRFIPRALQQHRHDYDTITQGAIKKMVSANEEWREEICVCGVCGCVSDQSFLSDT